MKKSVIVLAFFGAFSVVANAGDLNVHSKDSHLVANAKISQVYQLQAIKNSKIKVVVISLQGKATCTILVDSQNESNSLIAAINTGATVNCRDSEKVKGDSSEDFISGNYSLSSFLGN